MKTIQKNQFIKSIRVFLFTFLGTVNVFGQSFEQLLLINKEWVNQIPEKTYYSISVYTDKEEISSFFFDGVKADAERKNAYYLSDMVVDKFQQDSVGKSKSGKYIVCLFKPKIGEDSLELYKILELTETTLKTEHLRSGTILEYKAK